MSDREGARRAWCRRAVTVNQLLAEENAGTSRVVHGMDGREASHDTGRQRQQYEAEKHTAEEFGIRLN